MQYFDESPEREETTEERVRRNAQEREQLLREGAVRPYSQFSRFLYGGWWSFITFLFATAFFISAGEGSPVGMLLSLVLGGLCGRYAYRLWTWQARRLVFVIVF